MVNYQLGKIYKIVGNGLVYVGSTCEPTLARRLAGHVSGYKEFVKGRGKYVSSYKIIESGDYEIVLIENYPCENKDELHKRERFHKETITCVNIVSPFGMDMDKYTETNRKYNASRKVEKQQWNEKNKHTPKMIESNHRRTKKYHESHKEQIKARRCKLCTCECGGEFQYGSKARHAKTASHQYFEKNKLYYNIKKGLDLIKLLDAQFLK